MTGAIDQDLALGTDTIRLGDERDRLADKHDTILSQLADADAETESAKAIRFTADELARHGSAVAFLIDGDDNPDGFTGYGPGATVTVQGLTAGDYARVTDRVSDLQQRSQTDSIDGAHKNIYAAAGLVDAPFLNADEAAAEVTGTDDQTFADLTPADKLDAKLRAVSALPPMVREWLYGRVDALTTIATGNWKRSDGQPAASDDD